MEYRIARAAATPALDGTWNAGPWARAAVARIEHFHAKSSGHRPQAQARLLYDDSGMYVAFSVRDQYVVCRHTEPQSPVCRDSCVETFLQPKADKGYFNFELNCGGAMLLFYVTDPTRTNGGLAGFEPVDEGLMRKIRIHHSMPREVREEIVEPVEWWAGYFVPNEVFERYVGPLGPAAQRQWRGNFYKCADDSSHPHWASWNPVGEALNFHVPQHFAAIRFDS